MSSRKGDFTANRRLPYLTTVATIIGILSAITAKLLLLMIAFFTNLFYFAKFSTEASMPSDEIWGIFFILVPVVGSLLIGFMARLGTEKIRGHGIPEALEAILFGKSIVSPKVAILKPLSSAISIGSGGPFGAEGPIIMTGGAVGSILAQFLHLTAAERKTLLAAGAVAGMSAIFATPIAAVLLAVELLLFEWKPRSLVPVATASIVAAIVRGHLIGGGPLFPVPGHVGPSELMLFQALVSGLIAGVASGILSHSLYALEDLFQKLPLHWMWWPAIGGLAVGLGGWGDPRALGVGYDLIAGFLSGSVPDVGRLFLIKAAIWLIALASGTSGGVLAPLLIFGCALGSIESHWFTGIATSNTWSLISMSAIMAGMMRAPFTAILFSFELTRDGDALLPIFVASFGSYMVTVLGMKRSILTEKMARRGYDVFREYGIDPFERCAVAEVMSSAATFELEPSQVSIYATATCREAADLLAEHDIDHLLVVAPGESNSLLGVVTRRDLFRARKKFMAEEHEREKLR